MPNTPTAVPISANMASPIALPPDEGRPGGNSQNGEIVACRGRVCVDGKFFGRGGRRIRIHGVTYGPFAPGETGEPFPAPGRLANALARMQALSINSLRTYHLPPPRLLEATEERGMTVFIDVPWPKHVCFLDSNEAQREARQLVAQAARLG